MHPTERPDSLSRTLAEWRVAPPRDPHFRTRVWARIAAQSETVPWARYVRRHAVAVGGALACAVALGAATGQERARARADADAQRLAAMYVQAYDARAMVHAER